MRLALTAEQAALRDELRARLARYRLPRGPVTVSEMVRSPSGKPDCGWARRVAAGAGQDAASA